MQSDVVFIGASEQVVSALLDVVGDDKYESHTTEDDIYHTFTLATSSGDLECRLCYPTFAEATSASVVTQNVIRQNPKLILLFGMAQILAERSLDDTIIAPGDVGVISKVTFYGGHISQSGNPALMASKGHFRTPPDWYKKMVAVKLSHRDAHAQWKLRCSQTAYAHDLKKLGKLKKDHPDLVGASIVCGAYRELPSEQAEILRADDTTISGHSGTYAAAMLGTVFESKKSLDCVMLVGFHEMFSGEGSNTEQHYAAHNVAAAALHTATCVVPKKKTS